MPTRTARFTKTKVDKLRVGLTDFSRTFRFVIAPTLLSFGLSHFINPGFILGLLLSFKFDSLAAVSPHEDRHTIIQGWKRMLHFLVGLCAPVLLMLETLVTAISYS